jgi:glycosyltransferase involved in cell wall biosynthesis
MKPKGGSEILYENLVKHVGHLWPTNLNLILSICDMQLVDRTKHNILWQHLSYDQGAVSGMLNLNFVQLIDCFVYVSEWQRNQFLEKFPNDAKSLVIRNAITPIEYSTKPSGKIKLVYSSMPNRGLEILLDALELMRRDDIEVDVFSSNTIYGSLYSSQTHGQYDEIFHRCKMMSNVNFKGYALNQAVRKSLQSAHILAYPSIFEETSCLSVIEALAAGCKVVTTNLGAIPETAGKWATYVNYSHNKRELAAQYAEVLSKEIDNYWENTNLKDQSDWYNREYSWDLRTTEWLHFIKTI